MSLAALILCAQTAAPAEAPRAVLERWRESIELDLAREVALEAPPRVEGQGPLEREGEAIALAARALAACGERPRALSLLEAARPDPTTRGFVELAKARLALESDDLDRARRTLLAPEASPRFPDLPECWLLAGRTLFRGGEAAEAAPLLEHFLALSPLDPEAPSAWHMLAQSAIARGDPAAAAGLRERALESAAWQDFYRTRRLQVRENPTDPLPRLGIAELFLAAGAHERARGVALELASRWPSFCRGHEALARAERELGRLAASRAALERALACDPGSLRANLELARLLRDAGEKGAADARYARYRELGGREPLAERRGGER